MPKPLTLIHFTLDDWAHVCPYLRVHAPAQWAGIDVIRGSAFEDGKPVIRADRIKEADVVLIQRDFPGYTQEYQAVQQEARRLAKPVVFEIDDLLLELPDSHPDVGRYRKLRVEMLRAVLESDAVTCSTPALADYLQPFNSNVTVLPNYIDGRIWRMRSDAAALEKKPDQPVVIGYLGGQSHLPDLEMVTPVLERLMQIYSDWLKIKVWGCIPPERLRAWHGVEFIDVGLVDYAQFAAYFSSLECDIWIAPLVDDAFNRAKSPLKFLEYSTLGIPGVYSRIAPYESLVRHGENGLLAATPAEWEASLLSLIQSPDYRRKMGNAALETVRAGWMMDAQKASRWREAYLSAKKPGETHRKTAVQVAGRMGEWLETLEARLQDQSHAAQAAEEQSRQLEQDLSLMRNSTGWRGLEKLRNLVRRLAAPGNFLGMLLNLAFRFVSALGRRGILRRLGRGLYSFSGGRAGGAAADSRQRPLVFEVPADQIHPGPAFSLILVNDPDRPKIPVPLARAWLANQTLADAELVVWEAGRGTAAVIPLTGESVEREASWLAKDLPALCAGLKGRWVGVVSYDLLSQTRTYLEANQIALESDHLAFTINSLGRGEAALEQAGRGMLPGDSLLPLYRAFVRKDLLSRGFEPDLSAFLAGHRDDPVVAGKVLVHASQTPDAPDALPYGTAVAGADFRVIDHYILGRKEGLTSPWRPARRPFHPVNEVIPLRPAAAGKPVILMVHPFLAVGGAERVALNMMRGLAEQFSFVVVTHEMHDSMLGTTVDEFRSLTPYTYTLPDFLSREQYFSMMCYLIERFKPVTLYVANGNTWIYDNLPALKKKYPAMKIANQVYDHQAGWINRYDRQLARVIDSHVSINHRIDRAYRSKGVRPEQIYHIENGVDADYYDWNSYSPEKLHEIKQRLGLPQDGKIVTYIGRLHPQKRPMDYVELARRAAADSRLCFLMVGDGPLGVTVNDEANRRGIANLQRRSFYSPSRDIYAISDCVVLTSEYEGMPMVVLEAQSMGVPVVATDVGNIREVLEKTRGGKAVDAVGDVTGLLASLRQTLDHPPQREEIRQVVVQTYSLPVMAEGYRRAMLGEKNA